MAYLSLVYDMKNPESEHNAMSLMLLLESEILVNLENGIAVPGILKEVEFLEGGRLAELTVEIDDMYAIHVQNPMN